MKPDYYSVLVRVISAATHDPAQTRRVIYELARINLKKELWLQYGEFGGAGVRQQMSELETAIRGVEARCLQEEAIAKLAPRPHDAGAPGVNGDAAGLVLRDQGAPIVPDQMPEPPSWVVHERHGDNALVIHPSSTRTLVQPHPVAQPHAQPLPTPPDMAARVAAPPVSKRIAASMWSMLQLVIAAVLGVAIYATMGRFDAVKFQSPLRIDAATEKPPPVAEASPKKPERAPDTTASVPEPKLAAATMEPAAPGRPRPPGMPLPTVYGVYALNNGQLSELETLPIRVPDQRVSISASISTPSRTLLPDGRVAFVLYRRDFVTNAPEKAAVRVIARITRALTFTSAGAPTVLKLNDQWAVRGNSYEFRVAPVGDNPEMIVVRPERDDFTLSPGRYALVIKGQAYDFTVDGKITDIAQCLERTDAVNGAFYSECRNP